MSPRTRLNPSEHQIQSAFIEWADWQSDERLKLFYAIPNGAYKSKTARGKFKAEGLRSGVPDMHLPVSSGPYHSLYIEFKRLGEKLSPNQTTWKELLEKQGNCYALVYSVDEAVAVTKWYLSQKLRVVKHST